MRIRLAAVGKSKSSAEQQLCDTYFSRLPWSIRVIEVQDSKPSESVEQRKEREATLLLDAVKDCERLVALDEFGKQLDSVAFSHTLSHWRDEGIQDIAFLIGGADGHGKAVLDSTHLRLSLGKMTWPHLLVRALLAEQLYRAYSIQQGHPYHRA